MPGYQLSEAAAQDLEDVYLFGFFTFGENQADFYAETLKKAFTFLADNPLLGRIDKRLKPADSIHRFEHGSHIIWDLYIYLASRY